MSARNFDYVIVGGGSAGCVLAARLSEDKDVSVLLVEAGGNDRHPLFHIPAGFAKMTKGIASWGWSTVPQRHLDGRVLWYTQAKVIGGGSTINAQVYTRGHSLDYDGWAQAGCTGWSFREVLPYFRKAEDNDTFDNEWHGKGGPLSVSRPGAPLPISEAFFKAAGEMGIPFCADLAGPDPQGVGYYQVSQKRRRRSSAARGYLKPALDRPNLSVMLSQSVLRVVVEKGRAIGIEIARDGAVDIIRAGREVILTAGAIGSPKLLLQSGIGPAAHIESVGLRVVHDLPGVGSNLQDHLDLCVICECTGDHTYDKYSKPHWAAFAGLRYTLFRDGPAASSLFETGGFWFVDRNAQSPDIQFHLGMGSGIEAGIAKLANAGVTLNTAYLRPRSRGTVRLSAKDPYAAPLIDPNYWDDPYDRQMSIEGLRLAREIMRQKSLVPYVLAERVPGPSCVNDDEFAQYAYRSAKTDHHPAGTCAMGTGTLAVVSPDLKLRGIDGLRVCDASIMPFLVSSNTNAPVIMIAEKAADMIRDRSAPMLSP
ncbi:MAG: GMC family oxidoreductase N-terminal domain-containing protein [Rhizobiales bacterium]|nr:GMC family oxidoreductase N-terminal domain-containing protein [Hyphomicrobiales bacterium]